jgi:hypothetical protein
MRQIKRQTVKKQHKRGVGKPDIALANTRFRPFAALPSRFIDFNP